MWRSTNWLLVLLLLCSLVATGGCLEAPQGADSNAAEDPPVSALPTEPCPVDPTDADASPLEVRSPPDRPSELNASNAVDYVAAFERFYGWNDELRENTTDLTVNVRESALRNATETGYVVRLGVGVSETLDRDGTESVGSGYYTATYFVNDSTVVRATAPGEQRPGPDPRNGSVIRC